jgi:hypothetical protein
MRIRFPLFLVCFLVVGISTFGQVNDAQMWLSLSGQKRITRNITAVVNPEFRFGENIGELNRFSTDIGIDYKINKHFKGGLYYRFISNRLLDNTYEIRNRFYVDLSAKIKPGKFILNYRARYQNQYQDGGGGVDWSLPKSYLRNKISVKYDMSKRWSPSVSYELWTNINDKINDNYRIGVSLDYELDKRTNINASYLYNKEINLNNPWTLYVAMIGLDYTF